MSIRDSTLVQGVKGALSLQIAQAWSSIATWRTGNASLVATRTKIALKENSAFTSTTCVSAEQSENLDNCQQLADVYFLFVI